MADHKREMAERVVRTSLRSAPTLFSEAWFIYRGRWKTYAGVSLLPILALFGAALLTASRSVVGQSAASLLFYVLLAVSVIFLFPWTQVALTTLALNRTKSLITRDAFRQAVPKILPFLWIAFLTSFIVSGGFVLFVVPGFLFSIWFSFSTVILIAEDKGGMFALLKSREYVRGNFWGVLGRVLFIVLVSFLVASPIFVLQLIFGQSSSSLSPTAPGNPAWLDLISSLYNSVTYLVLLPVGAIYTVLVYENLKAIKGNFSFTVTTGRKALFVGLGIFGILLAVILVILLFVALAALVGRSSAV